MTEPSHTSVPRTEPVDPVQPLTVAFTLTLEDYLETLLWMHQRPDLQMLRTKRVLWGVMVAAPTIVLAMVAVAWSSGLAWREMAPAVVLGGIFGGLGGAFAVERLSRRWQLRRQLIKQLSATRGVDASDGQFSQPARVTVTAHGIESWTPSLEQRRPWNVMRGLDETTDMLLPRTDAARWIIIPKRDLDADAIDHLRRTISEHLGHSAPSSSEPPALAP